MYLLLVYSGNSRTFKKYSANSSFIGCSAENDLGYLHSSGERSNEHRTLSLWMACLSLSRSNVNCQMHTARILALKSPLLKKITLLLLLIVMSSELNSLSVCMRDI
jgi:hypothetical protein